MMTLYRQKNFANLPKRELLKKFYHNTGNRLKRRIVRTAAVTSAYPEFAVAKVVANTAQIPFGAAVSTGKALSGLTAGMSVAGRTALGGAIGGAPASYVFLPNVQKRVGDKIKIWKPIAKKLNLPENNRTLTALRGKVATKVAKSGFNSKRLNKLENMRNLDETKIGKTMAKAYKKGESIIHSSKQGLKEFLEGSKTIKNDSIMSYV